MFRYFCIFVLFVCTVSAHSLRWSSCRGRLCHRLHTPLSPVAWLKRDTLRTWSASTSASVSLRLASHALILQEKHGQIWNQSPHFLLLLIWPCFNYLLMDMKIPNHVTVRIRNVKILRFRTLKDETSLWSKHVFFSWNTFLRS